MKYVANLTADQISTLKESGELRNAKLVNPQGFIETMDLVVREGKVLYRFYPKAHFSSVVVVDDNALVLTQTQAKKLRKLIEADGEYIHYDAFKQYTDDQLKKPEVKEWLAKFEAKKQGKLDISSQELTRKYNEWRASHEYCRATSLILNSDMQIAEAVEPSYGAEPVSVYKVAEEVEF